MNNYTCVPLTSIDRHKKSSKDILGFFFFQNMAQHRHDANVQSEKLNNFINSNVTIVAWFFELFYFKSNVNIFLREQENSSKKF